MQLFVSWAQEAVVQPPPESDLPPSLGGTTLINSVLASSSPLAYSKARTPCLTSATKLGLVGAGLPAPPPPHHQPLSALLVRSVPSDLPHSLISPIAWRCTCSAKALSKAISWGATHVSCDREASPCIRSPYERAIVQQGPQTSPGELDKNPDSWVPSSENVIRCIWVSETCAL